MSHYHACVAELILQPNLRLPMRVSYQLTRMELVGLCYLKVKLGLLIRRDAAMLLDIDMQWAAGIEVVYNFF
jgi:hypothetical protein